MSLPGLDPEVLTTFAVLAICHSQERISAGLTVSAPGHAPETIAATDDIAVRADWLQQQFQQGPVVTAHGRQVVVCRDLAADLRWPDFGRMSMAVLGLSTMVSIEVPVAGVRASLNFYSASPRAFDCFDVDAALRLARLAAPSAQGAAGVMLDVHAVPHTEASQLAIALATVMAQHRVGSTDGFALLRNAARTSRRTLLAVGMDVVCNGGLPEEKPQARSGRGTLAAAQVGGPEMWRTPTVLPRQVPPATRPSRWGRLRTPDFTALTSQLRAHVSVPRSSLAGS